ncbi:MAG: RNA polymerase sigma factor [Aridibacter sp.]|jgi:RNA polymerase sigma-70 factor (ECF subfamily)|nr:sigma-70 family RNA polymerase sigma factor [Acidobacteriota bacterium]
MVTDLTDEQIVELAVSENPNAFGEIVTRWERKIFALCFGMLNREDEAKDAAQETFIAAYKNLSKFRGDAKVSSWLHRIAVNQCLTKKRREKTRSENFLDESDSAEQKVFAAPKNKMPSNLAEQTERLQAIRQAVNSLPEDLKQVIVMKEFEDMTFQEISDATDMPLSTVKSRLYTALKQLRMKLEKSSFEIV